MPLQSERLLQFRKQDREHLFRCEHATRVVATERDDHKFLLGVVFLIYVIRESLAPSETVRALSHGWTRRIEAGKRQRVELADQVCGRARGQLLPQLIVTQSGRINRKTSAFHCSSPFRRIASCRHCMAS